MHIHYWLCVLWIPILIPPFFPWIPNVHIFSSCLPHKKRAHQRTKCERWKKIERANVMLAIELNTGKSGENKFWKKKIIEIKFRFNFSAISILHFLSPTFSCSLLPPFNFLFFFSFLFNAWSALAFLRTWWTFSQFSASCSYFALVDGKVNLRHRESATETHLCLLFFSVFVCVCVCVVKSFR